MEDLTVTQHRIVRARAQKTLVDSSPALVTFFRRRLPMRRYEEAEDLSQETLLAALSRIAGGEGVELNTPLSYVLGIARRKFCDVLRDEYRAQARMAGIAATLALLLPGLERPVEDTLIEAELRRSLLRALRRLGSRERRFIRLRFFLGLSNHEACRRLGITPEKGSRLKYRILDKLRFEMRVKTAAHG